MFVCCECCVLSGRGLCDRLITRLEEPYRLWRVVVCDQKNLENEEAKAPYGAVENTTTSGCNAKKTNKQQQTVSAIKAIIRLFHKNLKMLVHILQNRQFIWDPIYIYINTGWAKSKYIVYLLLAHPVYLLIAWVHI